MPTFVLYLLFITLVQCSRAEEFLYPVGVLQTEDVSWIYVLHQKSATQIDLWQWDPMTHKAMKALLSTFIPAGLQVMPNNSGISFIDQGRIRVKKFIKRSPKALEICQPLYDIGMPSWLDENTAYFSAKAQNRSGIYQIDLAGNLYCIRSSLMADCLYPAKVGSRLFYIERSCTRPYCYAIAQCLYPKLLSQVEPSFNDNSQFEVRSAQVMQDCLQSSVLIKNIISDEQRSLLISFDEKPIAFLTMISETMGFCLGYPATIIQSDTKIPFTCYLIQQIEKEWKHREIFTFFLPISLIIPSETETSLYESIVPLLPRYFKNKFYFSDLDSSNHLHIKSYDLETSSITLLSKGICEFSPWYCEGKIYFGGSLNQDATLFPHPRMEINEEGEIELFLPVIDFRF